MLLSLDIRDILIIDRLTLDFQSGLNVLTGETGAGKSILLDALGFVLGWRGRADLVRAGADTGEVTAVFELGAEHPARKILVEAGLPVEDELVLRRTNTADGRKAAWINDRRASGEVLRSLSDILLELHGQQDDRGLLDPRNHRLILDDFGGLHGDIDAVRAAWNHLAGQRKALGEAELALAAAREEEEFLRHAAEEIAELSPQAGEEAALDTKRRLMQSAERIADDIRKALTALGDKGAEAQIDDASRWLDTVADQAQGQLDAPLEALTRANNELADAQQGIERCLSGLSFNDAELEQTEERLFAMRALARKHNVQPDRLVTLAADFAVKIEALDQGDSDLKELQQLLENAEKNFETLAKKLSAKRHKAAAQLDKAMAKELAPLKLGRAVFSTVVTSQQPGPSGVDATVFEVATNPGAPSGALNKIASGGELSRFLLALKVCLVAADTDKTMIFDEIDRGVGGATADAVGRRLAQIAEGNQVLVVTHSPQVAARGGHHWRVEKKIHKGLTLSAVIPLDDAERVDELARMLAGDTITDEARGAARALLTG